MDTTKEVVTIDTVLTIDLDSRTINIPKTIRSIGVESDDEVVRLRFSMPRYYGEFDLSDFVVRINYKNARENGDVYKVKDATVTNDVITFSWLVGRFATVKQGDVKFNVCLKKVDGEGESAVVLKEFNTKPASLQVLEGLETTEMVIQQHPDLVETWQEELFGRFHGRVDPTLSISGQAADAKETGDMFTAMSNKTNARFAKAELDIITLDRTKANKTDISSPYKFKGSTTHAELPSSGNTINDTYYCTDTHCKYTWNGKAWYQSSLDESAYTDELGQLASNLAIQEQSILAMFSSGHTILNPEWTRGGINGGTGIETEALNRFRTGYLKIPADSLVIDVVEGYRVYVFGYTYSDGEYTIAMNTSFANTTTFDVDRSLFYRFVLRDLSDEDYVDDGELKCITLYYTPECIYATSAQVEENQQTTNQNIADTNASITQTNENLHDLIVNGYSPLVSSWIVAGIDGGSGKFNGATNRIRTVQYFKPVSDQIYYNVAEGYRLLIYWYTYDETANEYTFVSSNGYYTGEGYFDASTEYWYMFVLRAIEDVEFTGDEYVNVTINSPVKTYIKTDDINKYINTYNVADYWIDELSAKEVEIKNIVVEAAKADNDIAMFFTMADSHYPANTGASTALAAYLSKKCGITLTVNLGDIIADSTVSHEDGLQRIQDAMDHIINCSDRMILTQGNHDNNAGILDGNGRIQSERIVYDNEWIHHTNSKLLSLNKLEFDAKRKAFYYDDDLQRIRFISIDSFEDKTYVIEDGVITSYDLGQPSNRQIEWVRNVALQNIPSGYAVVSFSHLALFAPYVYNGSEYVTVPHGQIGNAEVLTKVFSDFVKNGGEYIGHFAGHLHHDFVSTKNGITCVQSLNDGTHWREASYFGEGYEFVGDAPLKSIGTVTECAFDTVIINRTTRHVDLIRIGAGENRSFDY